MSKQLVKVQLPISGNPQALIYNEHRNIQFLLPLHELPKHVLDKCNQNFKSGLYRGPKAFFIYDLRNKTYETTGETF